MKMPGNANAEGSLQLLVAEDDPSQRQTITAIMAREGFEVTARATAREALERLESGTVDVAVVDLRLPDMEEDELLRRLSAFVDDVPIILNTGYASLESARSAVNMGAFAYVEKRSDPSELIGHVHRAVQDRLRRRSMMLEKEVARRTTELTATNRRLQAEIVERKRAEDALQQQRDFAEGLIETAQTIVLLLDPQGRIVRFNPYMEELSGYRLSEVEGKDWFDTFLRQRDRDRIREVFAQAIGDIPTRGNVNAVVVKDGRERLVEWYDKALKDSAGNVVGLVSVGQDITQRRRIEEERDQLIFDLQERVKELRCLYGALDSVRKRDAMADVFRDVVSAIPAAWQYPGITKVRIRFDEEEYASEGFEETAWCQTADIVVHGRKRGTIEVFLSEQWTEMGEGPFLEEERRLIEGLARELSEAAEHKQAQEKLRASEERYRQIVETANEGIWVIDAQANTRFANPRMAEMLGYSVEEMSGKPLMSFMDEEMQAEARGKLKRREQGIAEQHEHRFRRKDGTDLWAIVSTNPVFDNQGRYAGGLGMITDVIPIWRPKGILPSCPAHWLGEPTRPGPTC